MVQGEDLLVLTVVHHHVEGTRQRHDEFLILAEGMPAARFTARHIVYPIGALDFKRDVVQLLRKGEVATSVQELRQFDYLDIFNSYHFFI